MSDNSSEYLDDTIDKSIISEKPEQKKQVNKKPQKQITNKNVSESEFSDSNNSDDSDDDIEKEAEDLQITEEFKEQVIRYVKFDDLIKKKNEEIKELKSKRKPCEEYILKYLDREDISCIDINDGKLRKNKSETKVPLTYDQIKDSIGKKVVDPKIVTDILKLMDERPKKVNVNLKRTMNRGKRKK